MRNKKWVLFIMLCIISIAVAACSTSKTEGKKEESNTGSKNSEEEQVTLKWLVPSIDQPDQDKVWAEFNERLKEYLPNTTVEFDNVTIPEYAERWQLVAAAQEDYDIAWSFWGIPFVPEARKGAYYDMTDLMDEYAPDIRKELDEFLLKFGEVDGKQYAIPNWQPMVDMRVKLYTNKEWFDEFWSMEEAEKVFYARDERPLDQAAYDALAGYFQRLVDAGKDVDVSPHTLDQMQQGQIIVDPFVIRMQDENFEVVNKLELPEMKLFFDNMRNWYEKGYIRSDVLSNPDGGTSEDPMGFHAYFPMDDPVKEENGEKQVPLGKDYYISQLVHSSSTVIPASSKHPERAMQLIELMQTEKGKELFNFLLWGIEGEHYTKVSENRIETIGYGGAMPANPGSEAPYGLTDIFTGNALLSWDTQANPEGYSEGMQELHDNAWKSPLIGFKPDTAPIRTELAQVDAIKGEYWDVLALGVSEDYENLYGEMIDRMNKSGAEKIKEELQKQVDGFVQENGIK